MVASVLLPTFILLAVGYAFGRWAKVPSRPLAQLSFWVLSPGLIFESLRTAQLPAGTAGVVTAFTTVYVLAMFALSLPLRRWMFPRDPQAQTAASLVLAFGNCGNLGLPLLLFAYGQPGVDVGVVFLSTQIVLMSTLGVTAATWEGTLRWRAALGHLLRVPWPYAVVAAVVVRTLGTWPPLLARASSLLAQGAIPFFLLLLGIELARIRPGKVAKPAVVLALARLVGGSAVAWILAWALPVQGVVRSSLILEGSVPSAVNAFLLASQYERGTDVAAAALLLSTVLSIGTLSLTLFLLSKLG